MPLKYGVVPSAGTVKLWYARPAAVENKLPPVLPKMTPLLAKLDAPVPPRTTGSTPAPICVLASMLGMSDGLSDCPNMTRPLLSTTTFW